MAPFNKKILLIALALMSMAWTEPFQTSEFLQKSLDKLTWISIATMLVGITALVVFVILIYKLLKIRNARIMAMISKGIYQPKPKDWPMILLLVGIVLIFISPAVALLTIAGEGLLKGIGISLICFLGGAAILVFRHLAREYLPTPSKYTEQGKSTGHTEDTENPTSKSDQ